MLRETTKNKTFEERFIVRHPEMSDLEDVLEMLEICDLTMLGEVESSGDVLNTDWTNPVVSRERNFRLVTTKNGRVVGYGELWDDGDPLVQTWGWSRTHPEFEGQGIGTYLMEWAEKTARQSIDRVPDGARFSMASGTVNTYQPSIDLLTNYGMKLTRSFYTMEIALDGEIEAPVLPENITIRYMTGPEELATIVHAVEDSFQDHYGYVANSFETEMAFWSHMINTAPTFDPTLWFMAMDGDKVAGLSLCWPKRGPNENMGWVGTLGVLRPWRRQGLGLALLNHSFGELKSRGKTAVGLGVDADSLTGATRLYERAGMHVTRKFDTYEKEFRPGVDLMKRTAED